ncbi:MAG TPA: T9SS type A sorting domain-containing protein [Lutibacter sp.]|nr:T9SS type A sorting domain-containing protein [Lutibacter sp.]
MKYCIRTLFVLKLVFFFNHPINAQIVYTDIDPDITYTEFLTGHGVDFNADGKVDVHVTLLSNVGVWVMHLIPDSSADNTFVVYDGEEASILELEDEIAPSSNLYKLGTGWGGLLYGYWENDGEYGNWTGTQEDKYLGIKFEIGSNFHYGWIHLTTHQYSYTEMDFTIKGFAYNTIANEMILAGDMGSGVGIDENIINTISIFPNPTENFVFYNAIKNVKQITVISSTGKTCKNISIDSFSKSIDLSKLSNGVYFIRFQTDKNSFIKKILKE